MDLWEITWKREKRLEITKPDGSIQKTLLLGLILDFLKKWSGKSRV